MANFFIIDDFDSVSPIRKRNALEALVVYAKDQKLACTDSNERKTDPEACMQGSKGDLYHVVFPLLALNKTATTYKPLAMWGRRQIVVNMTSSGDLKVSSPVKAIPFVTEWIKTLCEDYSKLVDGDSSVVFEIGQRALIPHLNIPPRNIGKEGTVEVENDIRPVVWTLEEEADVKEIMAYVFDNYKHTPYVRMKIVTTVANMYMIQLSNERLQEMATDVGRVTDELRLAKALAKRELIERKGGDEGLKAKAEMFDISENNGTGENEWEFPTTGSTGSSSGSSGQNNVKSEAFKEFVPRKRS
jgi:hypothetical protein